MNDRKYFMHYVMSFDAFNNSFEELSSILKLKCFNLLRSQLKIKKVVAVLLYRFAHGFNFKHMLDRFDVGASTIRKYMDIVCDGFYDKNKFLDKYISKHF
jgi:hypothetical protein